MNILPTKSWHVRNKNNIERVRKDEAKAAEEDKERQRRIALAEQEARTSTLRHIAKKRCRNDPELYEGEQQVQRPSTQQTEHINFFSKYEEDKQRYGVNKEYEDEKKTEKEKYEKSIGLLTYLGQSSSEFQTEKPWYFSPPKKKHKDNEETELRTEADLKSKHAQDPMQKMLEYVNTKKKKDKKKVKDRHEKHRKHKHKHKAKEKDKGNGKTIEELRADRIRREQSEKMKTERLLAKMRGEKLAGDQEPVVDDRQRKYNSQYNPEFVRKPKTRPEFV